MHIKKASLSLIALTGLVSTLPATTWANTGGTVFTQGGAKTAYVAGSTSAAKSAAYAVNIHGNPIRVGPVAAPLGVHVVPEPSALSALALAGLGLLALFGMAARKRAARA